MTTELIRAAIVGVCAAAPVGPVLLLVVQKTLCRGKIAGMLTGFGSALADSAYAAVALVALSLAQNFMLRHQAVLMVTGALLLALVGFSMYTSNIKIDRAENGQGGFSLAYCPFQAIATALSNPAAIVLVAGLLGLARLGSDRVSTPVPLLVLAVFIGELSYWAFVVLMLSGFVRISERKLGVATRIAGMAVWVFSAILLVRGALMLLPPMR